MNQSEINELHAILLKWLEDHDKTPKDAIAFLTSSWVGQMALNGYSEMFVDATLTRMKENWKNHPLNNKKSNDNTAKH